MGVKDYFWRMALNIVLDSHLMKNRKRKYYIIKAQPKIGFFSNYFYALGHMMLAKKHGYVFAVDWENYKTPYNAETPINGKMNCWEYFFKQPNDLQTIYENCANPYVSEDKYP